MSNIMATFSFHPVVFSQDPTGNFFAAEPLCDTQKCCGALMQYVGLGTKKNYGGPPVEVGEL
jgi:hypothetical protein